VEPNNFQVRGADIVLRDSAGNEITKYGVTPDSDQVIQPGLGGIASFGAVSMPLIPAQVITTDPVKTMIANAGPDMALTFEVGIRIYGTTLGGENITATEYAYHVSTCYGCSVSFSKEVSALTGTDGTTLLPTDNCFGKDQNAGALSSDFCYLGEDRQGAVLCGDCKGNPACTACDTDAQCNVQKLTGAKCNVARHICMPG
jgi:hypothetical protein